MKETYVPAVKGFLPSEEGGPGPSTSAALDSVSHRLPNSSLTLLMFSVQYNVYS